MKKQVLAYRGKTQKFPHLGIIFVANRAVVTFTKYKEGPNNIERPVNHKTVMYGPLFWMRIGWACACTYYKSIKTLE